MRVLVLFVFLAVPALVRAQGTTPTTYPPPSSLVLPPGAPADLTAVYNQYLTDYGAYQAAQTALAGDTPGTPQYSTDQAALTTATGPLATDYANYQADNSNYQTLMNALAPGGNVSSSLTISAADAAVVDDSALQGNLANSLSLVSLIVPGVTPSVTPARWTLPGLLTYGQYTTGQSLGQAPSNYLNGQDGVASSAPGALGAVVRAPESINDSGEQTTFANGYSQVQGQPGTYEGSLTMPDRTSDVTVLPKLNLQTPGLHSPDVDMQGVNQQSHLSLGSDPRYMADASATFIGLGDPNGSYNWVTAERSGDPFLSVLTNPDTTLFFKFVSLGQELRVRPGPEVRTSAAGAEAARGSLTMQTQLRLFPLSVFGYVDVTNRQTTTLPSGKVLQMQGAGDSRYTADLRPDTLVNRALLYFNGIAPFLSRAEVSEISGNLVAPNVSYMPTPTYAGLSSMANVYVDSSGSVTVNSGDSGAWSAGLSNVFKSTSIGGKQVLAMNIGLLDQVLPAGRSLVICYEGTPDVPIVVHSGSTYGRVYSGAYPTGTLTDRKVTLISNQVVIVRGGIGYTPGDFGILETGNANRFSVISPDFLLVQNNWGGLL
jgi:hypothetical protein